MIKDTELLVIQKAIRNLETIGCKVGIIDSKGNVYGGFKLVPRTPKADKPSRAAPRFPRGTISGYLAPYLDLLTEAGDVIDIPTTEQFDLNTLTSSASSYMIHRYGKQSCKSESLPDKKHIRIFRLEKK